MPEINDLRKIVGDKYVLDDPGVLRDYSSDLSFATPMRPRCVVRPKDGEEVQETVKWANATVTPLIPISSGPPHFLGDTVPSVGGAVVVDLSRMKKIVRIDKTYRVALVEPGVTFTELYADLKREGLCAYTPLCPRNSKSVIGSMLERQPITMPNHHWDSVDPMLCAEIVFGSGDRFRTGGAAGPDTIEEQWEIGNTQTNPFSSSHFNPNRLIAGAQGTMGIVTWASFKCRLLSELSRTFLVPSESIAPLISLYYQLVRSRLGDHCFILNGLNVACLLGKNSEEIEELKSVLPPWVLIVSFEGYGELPKEKVSYQEADFKDMARRFYSYAIEPMEAVPGASAEEISEILSHPSEEEYWKLKYKGGCQDIFFLTTLDETPNFLQQMLNIYQQQNYPFGEVGVYLQMLVQGTSCHCEFNVYYDPLRKREVDLVKGLVSEGSNELAKAGAFFSRPYGPWAKIAYARASGTVNLQRRVKRIFDPNGISNPGKLCF